MYPNHGSDVGVFDDANEQHLSDMSRRCQQHSPAIGDAGPLGAVRYLMKLSCSLPISGLS